MKKIMFNDKFQLTQAVLEGRKTQTRRIIPKDFFSLTWDKRDDTLVYENSMGDFIDIRNSKYALCKAGEIVAVAQSYNSFYNDECNPNLFPNGAGWTNKMYVKPELMPHQIRITNVRAERLQDISDEDCLKEGIEQLPYGGNLKPYAFYDNSIRIKSDSEGVFYGWYRSFDTPREAYAALIDKVSGKGTWESNPYVFVYDFVLVKKWK